MGRYHHGPCRSRSSPGRRGQGELKKDEHSRLQAASCCHTKAARVFPPGGGAWPGEKIVSVLTLPCGKERRDESCDGSSRHDPPRSRGNLETNSGDLQAPDNSVTVVYLATSSPGRGIS